jgi:hypothetical protein
MQSRASVRRRIEQIPSSSESREYAPSPYTVHPAHGLIRRNVCRTVLLQCCQVNDPGPAGRQNSSVLE